MEDKNKKSCFSVIVITDYGRNREVPIGTLASFGRGYPFVVASELFRRDPLKYEIINRGIGGDKIVDLYARVKAAVWYFQPDVLSILVGINDIWQEIGSQSDVEIDRFERIYSMLIEDTMKAVKNVKNVLCEPFVLKGSETKIIMKGFCK